MTDTNIRNKITRFPHVATYQTGWAGRLTFAELHADLTPNMNRLLRYYRKPEGYLPDILQEGYMPGQTHEKELISQYF